MILYEATYEINDYKNNSTLRSIDAGYSCFFP